VTASRREMLWCLVAAHAAGQGRRVSVADVCAVAVSCAQVTGVWVTAVSGRGPDFVMGVTDLVSEQLAELQLTLGEGPCHDVLASAAPVLTGDLGDGVTGRRWPAFAPGAGQLGVSAVFAFPLVMGAIRAGTMGLHRSSPGPLTRAQLGDCLLLADAATVLLLDGAHSDGDGAAGGAGLDGQAPDLAAHRAEIDQATGMLTVQLGVSVTEAFARLRAYAYGQDRRLADVADDIVARRLRLPPDPHSNAGPAPDGTA
jgi:ANTAR domain